MQITTIPFPRRKQQSSQNPDSNHPISPLQATPSVHPSRMAVISHSIQENRQVFKEDPTLCVGERKIQRFALVQCPALLKSRYRRLRWQEKPKGCQGSFKTLRCEKVSLTTNLTYLRMLTSHDSDSTKRDLPSP